MRFELFQEMLFVMWEGRKHSALESCLFQCKKADILILVHFYSLWIKQNCNALSDEPNKWRGDDSCTIMPGEKMPKLNVFHVECMSYNKVFNVRKIELTWIFLPILLSSEPHEPHDLKTLLLKKCVKNIPLKIEGYTCEKFGLNFTYYWRIQDTNLPLRHAPPQRSFLTAQQWFYFPALSSNLIDQWITDLPASFMWYMGPKEVERKWCCSTRKKDAAKGR